MAMLIGIARRFDDNIVLARRHVHFEPTTLPHHQLLAERLDSHGGLDGLAAERSCETPDLAGGKRPLELDVHVRDRPGHYLDGTHLVAVPLSDHGDVEFADRNVAALEIAAFVGL